MGCGQRHGADDAERAGFRWCCKAEEDGAEHEEDQHDGGHHARQHAKYQCTVEFAPRFWRQSRQILRPHDRHEQDEEHEDGDLQDRRADCAEIHVADGFAELVGKNDQHERRRNDLRDGAGCGDDAGGEARIVTVFQHDRQRDDAHGDDGGGNRAGDRAKDCADDDDGIGEAARNGAEQLACAFKQIFGKPASLQDRAHEGEERNGEQQVVRDDAEDAQRQGLKEGRRKMLGEDADDAENQTDGGKRESNRKSVEHEDDHAEEHQWRKNSIFEHGKYPEGSDRGDHCRGFSYFVSSA